MKKLITRTIAGLKLPADKNDLIVFDADLPGFGLRLRSTRGDRIARSYVVQYRAAGRSRRVLIGSAEVLSVEQARLEAKKILGKAALGGDPQRDRQERRDKDKFSLRSVIDEYLTTKESSVRPRTYYEARRYLIGAYFKPLHAMPIDRLTRRDVAARLLAITRENGPVVAARARVALSTALVWAMETGISEHNPLIGTPRPAAAKARSRVLNDVELSAILRACNDDSEYGRVIWLLALLGCRRQEIGGMTWAEVDFERGVWTLPAERAKNGRQHVLPLPQMALDLIRRAPRIVGREPVFGTRAAGFTNWALAKRELDRRLAGTVQSWRIHDLRRTVATRMADLGVLPHVIEALLNHQSGHRAGVAGIYNRSPYEREVRAALALWADHIRTIAEGGERKVVAMRQVP